MGQRRTLDDQGEYAGHRTGQQPGQPGWARREGGGPRRGTKPLHSKKISEPPEPIEGAEQQVEQGEWPRTTTPLPASAAAVRNPAVRAFLDPTTQVGQAEVPSACAVPLPPVPVAPGLEAQ